MTNFELIRDKIKSSTTPAELTEAISFGMQNSAGLSDEHQGVLRSLIDTQKMIVGMPREESGKTQDPNVERVAQAYAEVDAEQFKPIAIETATSQAPTSIAPSAPPTASIAEAIKEINTVTEDVVVTPKSTKKKKEEVATPVANMYRVRRRVNQPINGVQYSNNEYEVEVSSTDQVTLLSELDAIEKEVIGRLSLYNKDALEAYGQKKYQEGVASVKVATPVVTPQKVNTFAYDMSQANVLDLQYTLARYQRLNSFVLQAFEKFPEVKAFYAEFDKVNPKVPQPNL